jgi:hypothetical protein
VNRLGAGEADEHVQVKPIALPDLTIPQSLSRDQNFSLFIPLHRKAAGRLIEILMGKSILTVTSTVFKYVIMSAALSHCIAGVSSTGLTSVFFVILNFLHIFLNCPLVVENTNSVNRLYYL